jgi:hypothetical protein
MPSPLLSLSVCCSSPCPPSFNFSTLHDARNAIRTWRSSSHDNSAGDVIVTVSGTCTELNGLSFSSPLDSSSGGTTTFLSTTTSSSTYLIGGTPILSRILPSWPN